MKSDVAIVLADLLERVVEDSRSGTVRDREELLALYPGFEDEVGRELDRLARPASAGAGEDSPGDPLAGRTIGPYRILGELGRGGQGVVFLAEDPRLGRRVALKVLSLAALASDHGLERFRRESRIASQLELPGICAVHDAGVDGGDAWIAMQLVEGRTLSELVAEARTRDAAGPVRLPAPAAGERARAGASGWADVVRAVHLVERLARTLHDAHEAGVVHRDVKPKNVMVTPRGDPVLLDFGLAIADQDRTLTATGDVLGTPSTMAPEQLLGRRDAVDRRVDVWALGVTLYEALTLRTPFEDDSREGLRRNVLHRDPPDPRAFTNSVPRDLVAVLEKALAKQPGRRYPTALALAEDLLRVRTLRPVVARRVGPATRLARWARRNPMAAVAIVALASGLTTSLLFKAQSDVRAADLFRLSALRNLEALNREADEALWPPHPDRIDRMQDWVTRAEALVAELPSFRAKREELHALAERASGPTSGVEHERLADARSELLARERALARRRGEPLPEEAPPAPVEVTGYTRRLLDRAWWIARPDRTEFGQEREALAIADRSLELVAEEGEERAWLLDLRAWALFALGRDEEAREVGLLAVETAPVGSSPRTRLELHLQHLEESIARESSDEGMQAAEAEVRRLREEVQRRAAEVGHLVFPPDRGGEAWWEARLTELIEGLEQLATGLLEVDGIDGLHGWSVPRRLSFARWLEGGFRPGGEYGRAWAAALPSLLEDYPGLDLEPQMGLVPLGRDPGSGLWEFAHLMTGEVPERVDGELVVTPETGVVLVLLPGGRFEMGAQALDPEGGNFDEDAHESEGPPETVELSPFFHSKYELTQAQWQRLAPRNPSFYIRGRHSYQRGVTRTLSDLRRPVEEVSWLEGRRWLRRAGLELPSEAQWEYAARGGTPTPWWTGAEAASLRELRAENLQEGADPAAGPPDGQPFTSPVGSYRANPFGLHDVLGNVREWCLDGRAGRASYLDPLRDPVVPWEGQALCALRGASYRGGAGSARVTRRQQLSPADTSHDLGLRPARPVDLAPSRE